MEPDQDFGAAEAPQGFVLNQGGTDWAPSDPPGPEFPAISAEPVEGLLYLGYLTEDVRIFGHHFLVKTLTRGERLAAALVAKEWEETLGAADAYQTAVVAASLAMVDGESVSGLGPGDPVERVRRQFTTVRQWYEPVVEALYEASAILAQRQTAAFLELQGK
jgi:hypothetical protein